MRALLLVITFVLLAECVNSQSITGVVNDVQGLPVKSATISLLKAKDSTVEKLDITKEDGHFNIKIIKKGRYIISATHIGYNKVFSPIIDASNETNAGDIKLVLSKSSTNLKQVTVVARKPLIEVNADKMIVNVEGTINSVGSDALELLRKSPGVTVDNEDNLSLSGKNGVQVFIDGRLTPLTGTDLSSYLKSLQSAQIEALEIITNPSAKYEAAGNAGIINIRLKKNKTYGTNGSVNIGYGIGKYAKYNGGIALNYRNKKINLFGNYTYSNSQNYIYTSIYRVIADSIFDQVNNRVITDKPHNIKAGFDYFINNTTTIGVIINAIPTNQIYDNNSTTYIRPLAATINDKTLIASNYGTYQKSNSNVNLNYRFAKADKELNVDVDYGYYKVESDQYQPNYYYNNANTFLYSRVYDMLAPSQIKLYSLKMNYDRDVKKGKLSIGGKVSYVNSNNDFTRFDVRNNIKTMDSSRSNSFIYKENINALFANYLKTYKKISVQVGLRAENTVVNGYTSGYAFKNAYLPYDSTFKRNYINLFPTASVTLNKNKNNQLSISYGRRIDRPAYQDLNPFEFKVDEYSYRKGNTNLRPQYTHSISLVNVYKNKFTSSFNYSYVKDVFTQIFDTADRTKSFITKTNLATQNIVSLNLNYAYQLKRYGGFINLNSFYTSYKANFGVGRILNLEAFSYSINTQQSFKFNKGFTAELTAQYNSPGIGLGFFKGESFGGLDLGLQKSFLQNKINVKASYSDIFYTMLYKGTSDFAGQHMVTTRGYEPRIFRINVVYRFGSSQVKAARQRKTGLEEENKRISTSGG